MNTILLQPEDSARVAEAIIHQLKHPIPFSKSGFAESLRDGIVSAVKDALRPNYPFSSIGQQIAKEIADSLKK